MHIRNLMLALSASLTAAACAPLTPNVDAHFGEAVNMAKAQQTINPDAGKNPDPVAGVDGKAAQAAKESYDKSYKAPPRTTITNTISIGGGAGGTGGAAQ